MSMTSHNFRPRIVRIGHDDDLIAARVPLDALRTHRKQAYLAPGMSETVLAKAISKTFPIKPSP